MHILVISLVTVVMTTRCAYSYPNGAPSSTCGSMVPGHSVGGQNSASPYTIGLSGTNYACASNVTVTLGGTSSFRGFMCQARTTVNDENTRVGTVNIEGQSGIQLLCNDGVVTHTGRNDKSTMMFMWVPGAQDHGNVYIVCTMVQVKTMFWVKQSSAMLSYDQAACSNNGGNGGTTTMAATTADNGGTTSGNGGTTAGNGGTTSGNNNMQTTTSGNGACQLTSGVAAALSIIFSFFFLK